MFRILNFITLMAISIITGQAQILAQDTVRQRDWPAGVPMDDETIEWRQDIYRELDLSKERNSGLYSPSDQEDGTVGLFAEIFDLALDGKIHLYKYEIDGNERLTHRNLTDIRCILDDYHISYTAKGDTLKVSKSDVPFAEVTTFYLKEAVYYDAINSSFSVRVIALCPVIVMEDEFSDEPVRYPMFWVKYQELEKYLHDIYTIADYTNIAGRMPMDEYFALNLYDGDIYKVYNAYGNALTVKTGNDSVLHFERQRIIERQERMKASTYNIYYSEKKEKTEEKAGSSPKVKVKRIWIFPWQKKKIDAARKEDSPEKKENKEKNNQK